MRFLRWPPGGPFSISDGFEMQYQELLGHTEAVYKISWKFVHRFSCKLWANESNAFSKMAAILFLSDGAEKQSQAKLHHTEAVYKISWKFVHRFSC